MRNPSNNSSTKSIAATLALAVLVATGCDRGSHPRNIATPAPQFNISDGTNSADLTKLRGHIVLLNFWATNCAPCIEELPSLLALQQQMPNLDIIAVSSDEDPAAYQHFLTRHNIDLLTIREPDQSRQTLRHRPDPRDLRHRPQRNPPPQIRLRPGLDQPRNHQLPKPPLTS